MVIFTNLEFLFLTTYGMKHSILKILLYGNKFYLIILMQTNRWPRRLIGSSDPLFRPNRGACLNESGRVASTMILFLNEKNK